MNILYEQVGKAVAIISIPEGVNIKHVIRSHVPAGANYFEIEGSELPSDRDLSEFGDALRANFVQGEDKNIHFDIAVAREITKSRLRRERISLFDANDIKLRDALLEGNQEKLIAATAERDRLRDVTLLTDQASTLGELRNLHP